MLSYLQFITKSIQLRLEVVERLLLKNGKHAINVDLEVGELEDGEELVKILNFISKHHFTMFLNDEIVVSCKKPISWLTIMGKCRA